MEWSPLTRFTYSYHNSTLFHLSYANPPLISNSPVWQVLDEDESHEGGHKDEVSLLKTKGALPVDADHADHAKVPHYENLRPML
jgi:hypothetical protein